MVEGEFPRLDLGDDYQEAVSFHHWFAMRGTGAARAAVALTASPDWLRDQEKLDLVATGDDAALAAAVAARPAGNAGSRARDKPLLDLCAGVGTIGAMAARLGFDVLSLELSNVPHLISQVLYDFPVSMAAADGSGAAGCWRGYVTEVEDFADKVWRGAKERLKELFEEDVDIRVWVRFTECPFCGSPVPLVSNARLSGEAALSIVPDPGTVSGGFPRFGLLHTEFPDLKGTFAKGLCTCPSCRHHFPFQGHELISLSSVPVAIRTRNSAVLGEIDSPDAYIQQVKMASYDLLAASSRRLGDRIILSDGQPIFHDVLGGPVRVRDVFLPRQRAYFAALAESVNTESALLAQRTTLTDAQRTAVRIAVALLISGQADYVNTCIHSAIDKPHPSTSAGPLRLGGLFTEVGGAWLERFWRNRLNHLLDLLRVSATAPRPVRAIKGNANAIPLGDAAVSAVIWDPPYYDKVDYDTVAGHYQSILAAVIPDVVGAPAVQARLTMAEWTRRSEDDLVLQAREARRVVSPNGSIGVFWLARETAELDRFLELTGLAALHLVHAVRLDTIRPTRGASADQQTYLLVLRPSAEPATEVAVNGAKVLSLAENGSPSLYDGLASLLESVLDSEELDELITDEHRGSSRPRLAVFLASHPELEQLLIDLGRPSLIRELVNRGARRDDLRPIDARGLARQLLARLGFAVARPVNFSIRQALRDCDTAAGRLKLADSAPAVSEAFLDGFNRIEGILRYTVFAWAYLECGEEWKEVFDQVVSPVISSYTGPDKLSFAHLHVLFTKLPVTFAASEQKPGRDLFVKIARGLKKSKIDEKLFTLVRWRNGVGHQRDYVTSLSVPQLRQQCSSALADARVALGTLDHQRFLPVTVRPAEERRYRYDRRVLSLLDPDDDAIEVYVSRETDLTEPLIYFASDTSSRRDIDPKFVRASVIESLSGLTGLEA